MKSERKKVKTRIEQSEIDFFRGNIFFTLQNMPSSRNKNLTKTITWNIAYDINSVKLQAWYKMLRISWIDSITDMEIVKRVGKGIFNEGYEKPNRYIIRRES